MKFGRIGRSLRKYGEDCVGGCAVLDPHPSPGEKPEEIPGYKDVRTFDPNQFTDEQIMRSCRLKYVMPSDAPIEFRNFGSKRVAYIPKGSLDDYLEKLIAEEKRLIEEAKKLSL